jgi:SAM-dependent methyltransferase
MDLKTEAYQQNYLQFRSLNQIMWQIPVLATTLTGGLWFGVSRILDNPLLVTVLLSTATFGNLAFIAILMRFRHVMECYMQWLKAVDESLYVDASVNVASSNRVERFVNRNKKVRSLFSLMLLWAAICSMILLAGYWIDRDWQQNMTQSLTAIDYYDRHAETLADSYESVDFTHAYPFLVDRLQGGGFTIVDIGAGTGRDAGWLADRGHSVVAVEPSDGMRNLAERLHAQSGIVWVLAHLPSLEHEGLPDKHFDFVLVNAVWMHVPPESRPDALARIRELLKPNGSAIVSLRIGPADPQRGMYSVDPSEFVQQAMGAGFDVTPQGDFPDVLGRAEVSWKVYELISPK